MPILTESTRSVKGQRRRWVGRKVLDEGGTTSYIGIILGHSVPMIVFPAQAEIQSRVAWVPAFAGMTVRLSSELRGLTLERVLRNPGRVGMQP